MKRVSKIIFISSVAFMLGCLLLHLIVKNSSFEFADNGDVFDQVLFIGIPIAILLTLFRLNYSNNPHYLNTVQLVVTIISGVFFFIIFPFSIFLNLCSYTEREVLFRSKEDPSIKIVERDFGCGAVDSTAPSIHISQVEEYPLGLIYVTDIDTNTLDLKLWDRVD